MKRWASCNCIGSYHPSLVGCYVSFSYRSESKQREKQHERTPEQVCENIEGFKPIRRDKRHYQRRLACTNTTKNECVFGKPMHFSLASKNIRVQVDGWTKHHH